MLFRLLLCSILVAASASSRAGAQNEDAPFSINGLTQGEQTLVLQAIGSTLGVYNTKLRLRGKPRLFCAPDNLRLDAAAVWAVANGVLAGPHDAGIVPVAVLDELCEKFPCDPKSDDEIELERLEESMEAMQLMKAKIEELVKERYAECLRATSSTPFCDCLNEMDFRVPFSAYDRVAGATRSQLDYTSLSPEDREGVDHIRSIRNKCGPLRRSP